MRALLEGHELAVAHLVEDSAWILIAEVVQSNALPVPKCPQRRRGELGRERQGLPAGENAVAAEHRHEPRKAGCWEAVAPRDRRREAQRGEIDEAASVRRLQRSPVALEARRFVDPALQVSPHAQL